jgi:hypothetical protein
MTGDLIFGICLVGVAVVLITAWPLGRAILRECLFHPLRRSVISVDSNQTITVQVLEHNKNSDGHNRWQGPEHDEPEAELIHPAGMSSHHHSR